MALAVVRSLGSSRRLRTPQELDDFEQELVDQYALAMVGAGLTDGYVSQERAVVFDFIQFLDSPVWTAEPADADRYLVYLRRERGSAKSTVRHKHCRWPATSTS